MFRRVSDALSREPFTLGRDVLSQVETGDDGEDLLLTGYAAPMGQSDVDIADLGVYHDTHEQRTNGPKGKETKVRRLHYF